MLRTKRLLPFIIVLLLFLTALPASNAERDSLRVIITANDMVYEVGDTIRIEVHVYDKGVHADAEEIIVYLDTHWQSDDILVSLSKESTGIYTGSYQIQEDDHHAWFTAEVVKGTDSDEGELEIEIFQGQFDVDIRFSNQRWAYAKPQDTLMATIYSTYRGELVDVDEFRSIRLVYPSDEVEDLTSEKISTGKYSVTFTIPEVTENSVFELAVHGVYANTHNDARADIMVNVLTVWYKLESMAGNTATFTMGVADLKGAAVEGALITIQHPQDRSLTTGEDGTVITSLTGVRNGQRVSGYVSANGLEQDFEGYIFQSLEGAEPDPSDYAFDVIYEGSKWIYDPGSSVSRTYKAYNCSIPLSIQDIYYYITMEAKDIEMEGTAIWPEDGSHIDGAARIIKTGVATTNELGEFRISFNAPSMQGTIYIWFESGIPRHDWNYNQYYESTYDEDDGLVYEEDLDTLFIPKGDLENSNEVTIQSEPLDIGGKTKFTIKFKDGVDYNDDVFAKWMHGSTYDGFNAEVLDEQWFCWVPGGDWIFLKKDSAAKKYTGYAVVPQFMPEDGYTVVAGTLDSDTGYGNINQVSLAEGETAGEGDVETALLLLLIAILAFAFFVISLGAMLSRKKGAEGQSGQPGQGQVAQTSPPPPGDYVPGDQPAETPSQPATPPPPPDYVPPSTLQAGGEQEPKS